MLTKTPGIVYKKEFQTGHFMPDDSQFEVCIIGLNNLGTYVAGFGMKEKDTAAFKIWTSTTMLKYDPDGIELGSDDVVFWSLHEPGWTDALQPEYMTVKIENGGDINQLTKAVTDNLEQIIKNPEAPANDIPEIGL